MPVPMEHIHFPKKIPGPDGRMIEYTPPSCSVCFQNMKDEMANKLYVASKQRK